MTHALAWLPAEVRKPLFWRFFVPALLLFLAFQPLNQPLVTSAAPAGIVSFELARTPANAQAMVASWDSRAQLYAAFGLGFDYLFMVCYALALALGALLAAGRHPGLFARLGAWVGWGAFLAALFDAVENTGLWRVLLGGADSAWPAISFWCACFKFTLIGLGVLYGLIGWFWKKSR